MTKKEQNKIKKEIADFKKDYPNVELAGILPGQDGEYKMVFKPKLATLGAYDQAGADVPADLKEKMQVNASVMYRDPLLRSDLDLAKPDIVNEAPHKLYERMKAYYRSKNVFGSFVRTMVNFALSGFENDCEDLKIKEFFDNWCQDVDIYQVLEWIFQEFYTTGFVRTYRVLGKYEPQVNTLKEVKNPPKPKLPERLKGDTAKEYAEKKKRWSKGYIPLAYTVLNPLEIEIKGSIFLNQTRVVMKPNDDMRELVQKEDTQTPLTDSEKKILDSIPPEIKSALKSGKDIELDPEFVGEVDYRRMPSEKYPLPPFAAALEVLEYKDQLMEADYSTLDGITSEILVVTVGDKDNPVLDDDDLRQVSSLFNTAQKAYSVVWNHTLKVQRVEVQNVDKIFGPGKFQQAETDLSGSIGLPRAMLDGVVIGGTSKDALTMATKAVIAELTYARNQVARWLRNEYRQIAEAFGFNRYPSIRWNEKILKDELAIMTVVQGLVDRRIISYYTAHKMLELDPEFELKKMEEEAPKVQKGIIGIIGSPYQKGGGDGGGGTQPTQKAPKGAPSEGRPPTPAPKTPAPATPDGKTKEVIKKETKHVKEEIRRGTLQELKKLSLSELAELEKMLLFAKNKKAEELVNLVDDAEENREE